MNRPGVGHQPAGQAGMRGCPASPGLSHGRHVQAGLESYSLTRPSHDCLHD